MTERQVLDIIAREFQAMGLSLPDGLLRDFRARSSPRLDKAMIAWQRAARRIVDECDSDCRLAAQAASMAGATITRGRTRL